MAKPRDLAKRIQELRADGKSYREIQKILGCAKSSISYHLSPTYKDTIKRRVYKDVKKLTFICKIDRFLRKGHGKRVVITALGKHTKLLYWKIQRFQRGEGDKMGKNKTFTTQDALNKIGPAPKCYLTGVEIDLSKSSTYSLDHIIPRSRGGDNSLENMGLCTRAANIAKGDKTPDEFRNLCYLVIQHYEST